MIFLRSIRREFTHSAAGIFIALFSILMTTQLIRLLSEAVLGSILPEAIVALLGFSALNYIPTILSISAFVAILLSLSRAYRDSEMVVWFSSGISLLAWIRPVLLFIAPLILAISALSFFVSPWAQSKSAEYRGQISARKDAGQASPGVFQESSSGDRVVFVEALSENEQIVQNVFVSATRPGVLDVTLSATGYQEFAPNGDRFIVLENGRRYEVQRASPEYRTLDYEKYAIRIEEKAAPSVKLTTGNMPTLELIKSPLPNFRAELLWRIGLPISAIVLALLAIPLSFVNPRAGRSVNFILAIFIYMIYNNLLTISQAWVASGKISFMAGVLGVHASMFALLPLLFARRIVLYSVRRFFR